MTEKPRLLFVEYRQTVFHLFTPFRSIALILSTILGILYILPKFSDVMLVIYLEHMVVWRFYTMP